MSWVLWKTDSEMEVHLAQCLQTSILEGQNCGKEKEPRIVRRRNFLVSSHSSLIQYNPTTVSLPSTPPSFLPTSLPSQLLSSSSSLQERAGLLGYQPPKWHNKIQYDEAQTLCGGLN